MATHPIIINTDNINCAMSSNIDINQPIDQKMLDSLINHKQSIDNFYHYIIDKYGADKQLKDNEYEWGAFPDLFCKTIKSHFEIIDNLLNKRQNQEQLSTDEKKICILWDQSLNNNNCDPISRELEILDAYLIPDLQITDITDLIHRITEYMYYAKINNIDHLLEVSDIESIIKISSSVNHLGKSQNLTRNNSKNI